MSNRRYPNDLRRTVAATGFKRFLGIPKQMAKDEIQQNRNKRGKKQSKTGVVFTVQSRSSARREKDEVSRLSCAHVTHPPPRIGTSVRSTLGGRRNAGRKQTASGREREENKTTTTREIFLFSSSNYFSAPSVLSLGCMCSPFSYSIIFYSVTALLDGNSTLEILIDSSFS